MPGDSNLNIIISAVDKSKGAFKGVNSNLDKLSTKMKKVGSRMKSIGKGMTAGLTLPLVGAGVAAGKWAMDFSDASRYANTMMQATEEEMEVMQKTAKDLASHTGKSAIDIMSSYYGIGSASYRGAEANKILKVATEGATGGFIGQKKSVDALVKVMDIYGKGGDEARATMDIMFGTVDKGLLTFDDLAGSFANASKFAVPLGLSVKEMGAAHGFLSTKMATASEAATALMGLTRAFIKPSEAMIDLTGEWARKQGLAKDTTSAQMIQTLGLKKTLDLLSEVTGGNVQMMGKLIPEAEGLTSALYLTAEAGAKELTENLKYLNDAAGLTKDKFNEASKSAKVKFNKALEKMKASLITIGDVLLKIAIPLLEKLADAISRAGKWFSKLSPFAKKFILIMVVLLAALGPILIILGTFVTLLSAISAPVILTVAAIVAMVVATVYLGKKIAQFIAWISVNWSDFWNSIVSIMKENWNEFVRMIKTRWEEFREDWSSFWEGIGNVISDVWNGIKNTVLGVWDAIKRPFQMLKSGIGTVGSFLGFGGGLESRQTGGYISETKPYLLHKGETVIPANGKSGATMTINITGNTLLDSNSGEIIGNQILETLKYHLDI